ncbi:MAG: CPXCG motif-containing cysteine-rich protein [Candidatus Halalkalibacterium sp. M3_1C_030]
MFKETQSSSYICAYCGETNHTFVDPSQGKTQKYIEDCRVCCRPNKLRISYNKWDKEFTVRASQS